MPAELIAEVDRVAGARKRSRFVEEAVRQRLARERLSEALRESAGALELNGYPSWSSAEKSSDWVAASREEDTARLARKISKLVI